MTELRHQVIRFDDSPSIDAFSRARVSAPEGIFDSSFRYDLQPLTYETAVTGSGAVAHVANDASAQLSATGGTDSAILQSRAYHHYIPAKSQLVALTLVPGAATANVTKRWGYFDANDGIFFEQDGSGLAVVRRSSASGSPVDEKVAQSSWNLDHMDGTGPSGVTIDASKAMICIIDLQWLGMGRVRVGLDIDGLIIYVHEFLHANVLSTVYMRTADLPIRWEIVSSGGADSLLATCASVVSEGGLELNRGFPFSYSSGAVSVGTGLDVPVIALRALTTYKTLANRIQLVPLSFQGLNTAASSVVFHVWHGVTVTGGAWVAVDPESAAQVNITGTAFTGGVKVGSFFAPATNQVDSTASLDFRSRLPLGIGIGGATPVEVLLTCRTLGLSIGGIYGAARWKELK